MRAGDLNRRIDIDEPMETQSASGAENPNFTYVGTVWGKIEPLSGRELANATQIDAELSTRITVRFNRLSSRITAKWRLRHGDVIYNVEAPAETLLAHKEIQVLCSSGLNQG